jgi:hypothetical protein
MELENIILSEVSQAQKDRGCMFSLIYGIQTQYKCSNIMKNRAHQGEVTYSSGKIK